MFGKPHKIKTYSISNDRKISRNDTVRPESNGNIPTWRVRRFALRLIFFALASVTRPGCFTLAEAAQAIAVPAAQVTVDVAFAGSVVANL